MSEKIKFFLFLAFVIAVALVFAEFYQKQNKKYFYENRELQLDFSNKKRVSQDRVFFMESIIRAMQYSNYKINLQHKKLIKVKNYFRKRKKLRGVYKFWFENLNRGYSIKGIDYQDSLSVKRALEELSLRVQPVPVSLALAQAILESAWGESRFAKEGHAYFGIHCYSKGCGMKFGNGKSNVYVKTYPDLASSVEDYIHFLNTKRGPKNFRLARLDYFESEEQDVVRLAGSLDTYSEMGDNYQKTISDLIRNYIPDNIQDY